MEKKNHLVFRKVVQALMELPEEKLTKGEDCKNVSPDISTG